MATFPDEIINQFKKLQNILMQLVTGFPDLNFNDLAGDQMKDVEAMIDSMMASLMSLIDPVFKTSSSLKLPLLPKFVAPIQDLMSFAGQMGKDPPGLTDEQKALIDKYKKAPKKPEIPQDWQDSLLSMKDTLMTVMALFPVCLRQLIFNMIDAIIGQIMALGGSMPYPLSLIPEAIKLMPKLIQLYIQFPQIFYKILEKKVKDMIAQIMALGASAGSKVNGIIAPTPACPEALKAKIREKKLALQKARKEQAELAKAQIQEKAEKEIKKQLDARAAADKAYRESDQFKKDKEAIQKRAKMMA